MAKFFNWNSSDISYRKHLYCIPSWRYQTNNNCEHFLFQFHRRLVYETRNHEISICCPSLSHRAPRTRSTQIRPDRPRLARLNPTARRPANNASERQTDRSGSFWKWLAPPTSLAINSHNKHAWRAPQWPRQSTMQVFPTPNANCLHGAPLTHKTQRHVAAIITPCVLVVGAPRTISHVPNGKWQAARNAEARRDTSCRQYQLGK